MFDRELLNKANKLIGELEYTQDKLKWLRELESKSGTQQCKYTLNIITGYREINIPILDYEGYLKKFISDVEIEIVRIKNAQIDIANQIISNFRQNSDNNEDDHYCHDANA